MNSLRFIILLYIYYIIYRIIIIIQKDKKTIYTIVYGKIKYLKQHKSCNHQGKNIFLILTVQHES